MDLSRRNRKKERVATVEQWWHSIDLGDGVVTDGHKTSKHLAGELDALRLPSLVGKTVLDIGAWDGFYSFEAERRGASRVVALDHFVWRVDFDRMNEYALRCVAAGEALPPFEEVDEIWQDGLPGRAGFDVAHELLESKVEPLVADFMSADLDQVGTFDVVFFLGVLYHMRHPLLALERLRTVTRELAVIETHAMSLAGHEDQPMWEFFERDELSDDWTNWWCPNMAAVLALCRAAGFRSVEVTQGPPAGFASHPAGSPPAHYRAIVHARP